MGLARVSAVARRSALKRVVAQSPPPRSSEAMSPSCVAGGAPIHARCVSTPQPACKAVQGPRANQPKESALSESYNAHPATVIKVIRCRRAGGNAVSHMAPTGWAPSYSFAQIPMRRPVEYGDRNQIQLGESGLGAGSDPMVGRESAIRERSTSRCAQGRAHGVHHRRHGRRHRHRRGPGGRRSGARTGHPDGRRRVEALRIRRPAAHARGRRGHRDAGACVDSLIIVLNSRLEEVLGDDVTQKHAFAAADEVLSNAVAGIAEIINVPGMVNVDFQDVRTVMRQTGMAMMGSASTGDDRAATLPNRPSPARCSRARTCAARAACWSTSPPPRKPSNCARPSW